MKFRTVILVFATALLPAAFLRAQQSSRVDYFLVCAVTRV